MLNRLLEYYFRIVLLPLLWVLGGSLAGLLAVLCGISWIEARRHRPTVFQLEVVDLGGAPLWVLMMAGMLVMNGLVMMRWALITADVGRRSVGRGYEINIPFPLARIAAANVLYIGLSVIVFYALRSLV